jgi:hypothetical protein
VGIPVDVSVNATGWPVVGEGGEEVKLATGGAAITDTARVVVLKPTELVAVRATV